MSKLPTIRGLIWDATKQAVKREMVNVIHRNFGAAGRVTATALRMREDAKIAAGRGSISQQFHHNHHLFTSSKADGAGGLGGRLTQQSESFSRNYSRVSTHITDRRFMNLGRSIGDSIDSLNTQLRPISKTNDSLDIQQNFEVIAKQFNLVARGFTSLDQRFQGLEKNLERTFQAQAQVLTNNQRKVAQLVDQKMDAVDNKMNKLTGQVRTHDRQLDKLVAEFAKLKRDNSTPKFNKPKAPGFQTGNPYEKKSGAPNAGGGLWDLLSSSNVWKGLAAGGAGAVAWRMLAGVGAVGATAGGLAGAAYAAPRILGAAGYDVNKHYRDRQQASVAKAIRDGRIKKGGMKVPQLPDWVQSWFGIDPKKSNSSVSNDLSNQQDVQVENIKITSKRDIEYIAQRDLKLESKSTIRLKASKIILEADDVDIKGRLTYDGKQLQSDVSDAKDGLRTGKPSTRGKNDVNRIQMPQDNSELRANLSGMPKIPNTQHGNVTSEKSNKRRQWAKRLSARGYKPQSDVHSATNIPKPETKSSPKKSQDKPGYSGSDFKTDQSKAYVGRTNSNVRGESITPPSYSIPGHDFSQSYSKRRLVTEDQLQRMARESTDILRGYGATGVSGGSATGGGGFLNGYSGFPYGGGGSQAGPGYSGSGYRSPYSRAYGGSTPIPITKSGVKANTKSYVQGFREAKNSANIKAAQSVGHSISYAESIRNAQIPPMSNRIDRSQFKAELANNPELKNTMMQMAFAEVGNNPQAQRAVIETMMNRAAIQGTTLENIVQGPNNGKIYYAPWKDGGFYGRGAQAMGNPDMRSQLDRSFEDVLSGSNLTNGATHNGSAGIAANAMRNHVNVSNIGGETFSTKAGAPGDPDERQKVANLPKLKDELTGTSTQRARRAVAKTLKARREAAARGLLPDDTRIRRQAAAQVSKNRSGRLYGQSSPTGFASQEEKYAASANRAQFRQGVISVGGKEFVYGSGHRTDGNYPSIPYGDYPVTDNYYSSSMGKPAIGINNNDHTMTDIDPKIGRRREGIVFHAGNSDDMNKIYTHGCIGIARSQWNDFQQAVDKFKADHGGQAYVHVGPDGSVISIDEKPTLGVQQQTVNQMVEAQKNAVAKGIAPPIDSKVNPGTALGKGRENIPSRTKVMERMKSRKEGGNRGLKKEIIESKVNKAPGSMKLGGPKDSGPSEKNRAILEKGPGRFASHGLAVHRHKQDWEDMKAGRVDVHGHVTPKQRSAMAKRVKARSKAGLQGVSAPTGKPSPKAVATPVKSQKSSPGKASAATPKKAAASTKPKEKAPASKPAPKKDSAPQAAPSSKGASDKSAPKGGGKSSAPKGGGSKGSTGGASNKFGGGSDTSGGSDLQPPTNNSSDSQPATPGSGGQGDYAHCLI